MSLVWNSFLDQLNINVLINNGTTPLDIALTLLDLNGVALSTSNFTIPPKGEFDVILNDLTGYSPDTYGSVKLEFDDSTNSLEGHSALYRLDPNGAATDTAVEFSFINSFENAQQGNSYAFFNTMQQNGSNTILQWLQIINSDASSAQTFTVNQYDLVGTLINTVNLSIPANGRRDIQGGHEIPGANQVGLIEIVPQDQNSNYLASIFRYGLGVDLNTITFAGALPFDFAHGDTSRAGISQPIITPISRGANAQNWLVVGNTGTSTALVDVEVFTNSSGLVQTFSNVALGAKAQSHILMNDFLQPGESGLAKITPQSGATIVARGDNYFLDPLGEVTTAYTSKVRLFSGGEHDSGYNTYLGQFNWLKLFNTSTSPVDINVEVYDGITGGTLGSQNLTLSAQRGIDLELVQSLNFNIPADNYGLVRVTPNVPGVVSSEALRIRQTNIPGEYDIIKGLFLR